mgnify:CR=1 FL=1
MQSIKDSTREIVDRLRQKNQETLEVIEEQATGPEDWPEERPEEEPQEEPKKKRVKFTNSPLPQAIQPFVYPNQLGDNDMDREQLEVTDFLQKSLAISRKRARRLLNDENRTEFNETLREIRVKMDLNNVKIIRNLQNAVDSKVSNGSLEQARAGALAIAILIDKVWGEKPKLSVQGKNIQVNMGWKVKPYASKNQD